MSVKTNRELAIRTSAKMAFSGVVCALASATMFLTALVPNLLTYLSPGIAGVLILLLYFEFDTQTAITAYVATAMISFMITPAKESCMMFLFFFGYYPVVHMVWQKRIKSRALRFLLGVLLFNATMITAYFCIFNIFGWGNFADTFGNLYWGILILGNITYIGYDFCLDNFLIIYQKKLHKMVARLFKLYR